MELDISNVFIAIMGFIRSLFDGALNIWSFLTTSIGIGSWTFTPLDIFITIIGVLIVAWLVKKLVPVA